MPLHLEQCIEQLYRGEMLTEATVKEVCERMKELLLNESNVLSIKSPITVVGDVHGCAFYFQVEQRTLIFGKAIL